MVAVVVVVAVVVMVVVVVKVAVAAGFFGCLSTADAASTQPLNSKSSTVIVWC